MTLSPAQRHDLEELLHALCEESLDDAGHGRLAELLAVDEEAQQIYLETLEIHANLAWDFGAASHPAPAQAALDAPPPAVSFPFNLLYLTGDTPAVAALLWFVMALGAGMVLMLGAMLVSAVRDVHVADNQPVAPIVAPTNPSPHVPAAVAAQVTRMIDCRWKDEESSAVPGEKLTAGRVLRLRRGLAEIVFARGAKVYLQGPAKLEIGSAAAAFLEQGTLTASVENQQAKGFEVCTPGMKFVDLGTEFGVKVLSGGVQEVHVFRGSVQAGASGQWPNGAPAQRVGGQWSVGAPAQRVDGQNTGGASATPATLLLTAHEAIRVTAADKPVERIAAAPHDFVREEKFTRILHEQDPAFVRWQELSRRLCRRGDLVAYYDFQPDEQDRSVLRNRAASGQRYDGRIEGGAEWVDGRLPAKQALLFVEHRAGVRVNVPVRSTEMTLAAWARVDALPGISGNVLLMSNGWSQRPEQTCFQIANGGVTIANIQSGLQLHSPQMFTVDGHSGWHFLAATLSQAQGTARLYLDGRSVAEGPMHGGPQFYVGEAMIGNWDHQGVPPADWRPFGGCIEELMIFDRALTPAQLKTLYEGQCP
jgi:hypothetical protein